MGLIISYKFDVIIVLVGTTLGHGHWYWYKIVW